MTCLVRTAAAASPDSIALRFETQTFSWAQAQAQVTGWERWLERRGVTAGQRVACLSWNRPELLWLFFALSRRGASLVPLNARLTSAELEPLVLRANASLVLVDSALGGRIGGGTPLPRVDGVDTNQVTPGAERNASRELVALFTSGTTGTPSLIPLTVANFEAAANANAANLGSSASHRWLGTLPLFHIGGLAMAWRWAWSRSTLVLEPTFDAARVHALLSDGSVTHASLVPTALSRVLDCGEGRFSSNVEAVLIGGGPMGAGLLERARSRGLPVLQTYGLTEACSQVATERPSDADGSSAGTPLPGIEVQIVDPAGAPVPAGQVGSIRVRGPTVTPLVHGWLETNDLGCLDAKGRLTILSRRVDLIISGGENVYPAEVEAVLLDSGLLIDVAVAPANDAVWGQMPVAFVVWRGGEALAQLEAFARARLATFKVPRRFETRLELPRNAAGKLLRHQLSPASTR